MPFVSTMIFREHFVIQEESVTKLMEKFQEKNNFFSLRCQYTSQVKYTGDYGITEKIEWYSPLLGVRMEREGTPNGRLKLFPFPRVVAQYLE